MQKGITSEDREWFILNALLHVDYELINRSHV